MKHLNQDWFAILRRRAASRRDGKVFWLVLFAFVLALNLYAPAEPTVTERILATAIILIAFGSIWRWIYRGEGIPDFGFLPVVLIVYSLEYALPIFTLKVYSMELLSAHSLPDPTVEKALLLALAGLISILFGYYYPGRRRVAQVLPKFRMQWRNKNIVLLVSLSSAGLGLVVFLVTFQIQLSPETQAFVNLPSEFFYLAIISLLILLLESEVSWWYAALLWVVLIPLRALIGLAQGQLGSAMLEAAALLIAYATIRRRIPWAIFVVGFAAFFFVQPVKGVLRSMVFAGGWINREQSQSQKFEALAVAGEEGITVVENLDPGDLLAVATNRLASIMVMATVVGQTPEDIPYWDGATYYPLLFVAVPRFLYPDKPSDVPGNVFGHKYGILPPDNWVSSINVMQLLDLYGNFGPIGVVLGSILIGMIYRTINDLFITRACGLGALVAGIFLFFHLVDIENAPVPVFGGLLIESLTVVAFHYGIRFAESLFAVTPSRGSLQARGGEAGPAMVGGGAPARF
jgi:hypothetical protein